MFALLLHFVFTGDIKGTVIMEPNSVDKHVIDVNATARKHAEIAPHIFASYALPGCDSVSALHMALGSQLKMPCVKGTF